MAAGRNADDPQGLCSVHQRAADHAGRRRHPLAQRGAAPAARSLRLPAPGPLFQGRAVAGEGAREDRHGHLPRELGGHLRRHRMGSGIAAGEKAHRLPDQGDGCQEDPLPGHVRHRHQAGVARRHRAPDAQGGPVRDRQRPQVGGDRAQGQHHEIHRRRLPRLGLRAGAEGIRRQAGRRRSVVLVQESEDAAARSSSRT